MSERKKVYFAGSIRGGRADADLYREMIEYIKETADVLTEHVGKKDVFELEKDVTDFDIYEQDTAWIRACDLLIAECTCPSLGVGYELAYAEKCGQPCYLFYDRTKTQLSAMLTGDPYFTVVPYEREEEIYPALDRILGAETP